MDQGRKNPKNVSTSWIDANLHISHAHTAIAAFLVKSSLIITAFAGAGLAGSAATAAYLHSGDNPALRNALQLTVSVSADGWKPRILEQDRSVPAATFMNAALTFDQNAQARAFLVEAVNNNQPDITIHPEAMNAVAHALNTSQRLHDAQDLDKWPPFLAFALLGMATAFYPAQRLSRTLQEKADHHLDKKLWEKLSVFGRPSSYDR